jgi:hypothetical protein
MDGKVLTQIFPDEYLTAHPIRSGNEAGLGVALTEPQRDYSISEEAAIKARLQGLGYIE